MNPTHNGLNNLNFTEIGGGGGGLMNHILGPWEGITLIVYRNHRLQKDMWAGVETG